MFEDLDAFIDKIRKLPKENEKELEKIVKKRGATAWRQTMLRTPLGKYDDGRVGGTLRRGWNGEYQGDFKYKISNNIPYADAIEFGHRTRKGTGSVKSKINSKSFIDGRFMLRDSINEQHDKMMNEVSEYIDSVFKELKK